MRKVIKNIDTRYLERALFISLVLDMLHSKHTDVSSIVTFNWLSPIFGIVDLTLACILLFRIKEKGISYIPKKYDTLTIEKSFLIFNKIHYFSITIANLYNNLEKWMFKIKLLLLGLIGLISLLSLLNDLLLFSS